MLHGECCVHLITGWLLSATIGGKLHTTSAERRFPRSLTCYDKYELFLVQTVVFVRLRYLWLDTLTLAQCYCSVVYT